MIFGATPIVDIQPKKVLTRGSALFHANKSVDK